MNEPGKHCRRPMPIYQRIALGTLGLGLAALLVMAGTLVPDERGHGTHEQLGMPPCTFSLVFQRPCPACGMTTSWACLVRGDAWHALAANAGGALLAGLSLAGAPWLLVSAVRGRWLGTRPSEWTLTVIVGVVTLATVAQWLWRLSTFR